MTVSMSQKSTGSLAQDALQSRDLSLTPGDAAEFAWRVGKHIISNQTELSLPVFKKTAFVSPVSHKTDWRNQVTIFEAKPTGTT